MTRSLRLVSNQDEPRVIAADSVGVYWTHLGTGGSTVDDTLMKLTRP
jgi:hypothetical protein